MSDRHERRRGQREQRRSARRAGDAPAPGSGPAAPAAPVTVLDFALAGAIAAGALALYARTSCPTIFSGDSAELATAAATFGVPHPPGYPLYTLLTGIWVNALPWSDPAFGANLASALYAGLTLWLFVLLMRRLDLSRPAAALAALCLGTGTTFWSQSTIAEVYTFDLLLAVGTLHAVVSAARGGAPAMWLALGVACGSWILHRPVNVAYVPSFAVLYLAAGGGLVGRRRVAALCAGVGLALVPIAYLPLASARDPALDVGDPERLDRLWVVLSGGPYRRHLSLALDAHALGRLRDYALALPRELGVGTVLGLVGAVAAWGDGRRGRRALSVGCLALALAGLAFAAVYNILDVQVYFLPSFLALSVLTAVGVDAARARLGRARRRLEWAWPALGLALVPVGFAEHDLSDERFTRLLAEDLLRSVDESALLFVEGDTSIHALWYLQAVERRAPGVVVFSSGHVFPWYVEQLRARYPEADWPPFTAGDDTAEFARQTLLRVGVQRPAYHSFTVRPQELLRSQPGLEYATVPQGLTQRILRTGNTHSISAACAFNEAFFPAALERLGPIPREVGIDTKSILLQYAIALSEAARFMERAGRAEAALETWRAVARFEPDRHWEDVRLDTQRIGIELPRQSLGRDAAAAVLRLERQ